MATAPESGKGGPSAQLVKELRDRTGAGFADCRAALVEAAGDIEQAINVHVSYTHLDVYKRQPGIPRNPLGLVRLRLTRAAKTRRTP